MRTVALVGCALALGACVYAAYRVLFPAAPEAPAALTVTVEALPRPAGVSGAAVDVSARGSTWATCWEDGSVTVRRGSATARLPPPAPDEAFRHACVAADGRVVAVTARGRLFDVGSAAATDLRAHVQAGSRLAAGPSGGDVWIAGEAGALRRLDRAAGSVTDAWSSGEPPTSALFSTGSHVLVGRIEGDVVRGPVSLVGEPPTPLYRLEGAVTALAESGGWLVAGDDRGHVRARRTRLVPSGASAALGGAVVALALPPAAPDGRGDAAPLLVVHAPASATVLEGGSYERRVTVALDGSPRAGCPLDDGQALLVATDKGERIVRVKASGSR